MTAAVRNGQPARSFAPPAGGNGGRGMRFSVDAWDPSYGTSTEVEDFLAESTARVDVNVELPAGGWRAIDPDPGTPVPAATLFVDGVRRVEARVWIEDGATAGGPGGEASMGLCASYAAGVVCCCGQQAHLVRFETRRGLFTVAPRADSIVTWAGEYTAHHTPATRQKPLPVILSEALQGSLRDVEVVTAVEARAAIAGHGVPEGGDLLVIDGPLSGRQHLPRALGYIKSHRTTYLPPDLNALVGTLSPGQRTPVFLAGTNWDRHTWYLRLPGAAGPAVAPWAGIVRIECSADLPAREVTRLAGLSQACLGRFASAEYKDARAPQNLYPIAGLERELRRRLGDPRMLYRALRLTAQGLTAQGLTAQGVTGRG
jgi:hypothetical protein